MTVVAETPPSCHTCAHYETRQGVDSPPARCLIGAHSDLARSNAPAAESQRAGEDTIHRCGPRGHLWIGVAEMARITEFLWGEGSRERRARWAATCVPSRDGVMAVPTTP